MVDKTDKIIALIVGTIFVTLTATGIQVFFVNIMDNYGIDSSSAGVNESLMNSSAWKDLENTTKELEEAYIGTQTSGTGLVSFTSWLDTFWNKVSSPFKTVYNSIKITTGMVRGAKSGVLQTAGVGGDKDWLNNGLVAIISITIILMIIGWLLNR